MKSKHFYFINKYKNPNIKKICEYRLLKKWNQLGSKTNSNKLSDSSKSVVNK